MVNGGGDGSLDHEWVVAVAASWQNWTDSFLFCQTYQSQLGCDSLPVFSVQVESEESVKLRHDNSNTDVQSQVLKHTISDGAKKVDFKERVSPPYEKHSKVSESVELKNVYRLQVVLIFFVDMNRGFYVEHGYSCHYNHRWIFVWNIIHCDVVRVTDVETCRDVRLHVAIGNEWRREFREQFSSANEIIGYNELLLIVYLKSCYRDLFVQDYYVYLTVINMVLCRTW